MLKVIWIYLCIFILCIIFKLLGQRCQSQVSLNMESPWQNNPNKFPCGREQITQETEMTLHAWWFVYTLGVTYQCLCKPWSLSSLTRFVSGEETDWFKWSGANPPPHPCVSLIKVTHDSWVKPTLLRGIGLQFYHSFPFTAVEQQMAALLMYPTPPRICIGLLEQECNVRGQIKSEVGCLLHGWLPPLALKLPSSLLSTFH